MYNQVDPLEALTHYKSVIPLSELFSSNDPPLMLPRLLPLLVLALNALAIPTASEKLDSRANAACTNPTVRKEWRSFTDQQKQDWIAGIKVCCEIFSSNE